MLTVREPAHEARQRTVAVIQEAPQVAAAALLLTEALRVQEVVMALREAAQAEAAIREALPAEAAVTQEALQVVAAATQEDLPAEALQAKVPTAEAVAVHDLPAPLAEEAAGGLAVLQEAVAHRAAVQEVAEATSRIQEGKLK